MAALAGDVTALFEHDALVLSRSAASRYGVERGARLVVDAGAGPKSLRVIDVLPEDAYAGELGIMDIGAAQWTPRAPRPAQSHRPAAAAGHRPRSGARAPGDGCCRRACSPSRAQVERGRAAAATRAYRVNLDVLALVALLTGAFVVFATQWLSILRRRGALGLLRALGVTRAELRRALLGEALVGGLVGSVLGMLLGALLAARCCSYLGGDLGNRQLAAIGASLRLQALPLLGFAALGTTAAWPAGHCRPGRPRGARRACPQDRAMPRMIARPCARHCRAWLSLLAGAALAWLPPVGGLPLARLSGDRLPAARCRAAGPGPVRSA